MGQQAVDAGKVIANAQAASVKAAEANVAAWQAWMRLWGAGPW